MQRLRSASDRQLLVEPLVLAGVVVLSARRGDTGGTERDLGMCGLRLGRAPAVGLAHGGARAPGRRPRVSSAATADMVAAWVAPWTDLGIDRDGSAGLLRDGFLMAVQIPHGDPQVTALSGQQGFDDGDLLFTFWFRPCRPLG